MLGQTPASLALRRPLGSPCRRFWSESERKAGRGPPLRKIMASRPRKSAVRPVYSSPPEVGWGQSQGRGPSCYSFPKTLAGSHPPRGHPCLGITHLQRCWRRDGWARVDISPAHFPHCWAPGGAHAGGRGRRGVTWESSTGPYPAGNGHHMQLGSGVGEGWKAPSAQGLANGVSSLAQRHFSRPLKPLP